MTVRDHFKFVKLQYIKTHKNKKKYLFRYAESLTHKAKFLELPYEGTNISMLVVLPNEVDGLQEIENQLERYLQPPRGFMENVQVKLPSFLTESEFDLIPALQKVSTKTSS